jgi:phosphoserine phosphatase RsbU/P
MNTSLPLRPLVELPKDVEPVGRRRVLVVDDSAPQRMVLAKMLRRWGYSVLEAGTGAEALEVVAGNDVDIVLSDWIMPGMSGVEFCRCVPRWSGGGTDTSCCSPRRAGRRTWRTGSNPGGRLPDQTGEQRRASRAPSAARAIVGMQEELRDKNDLLSGALDQLKRVHEGLNRDLVEARRFQQSLIPDRVREFDGGRVSLMFRPCGHVGGDFIGIFRVSETRIGLYSIDVSGHGIASALLAARIAGYLSGASPEQNIALTIDDLGLYTMRPPVEVCERLNELMLSQMETDLYLTMLLADCNLKTGEVRMVQAGHPAPVVQRASGELKRYGSGGVPVGLIPGATWAGFDVKLEPGDRLFALTDGITECPGPDGEEFGEEGFERFLSRHAGSGGSELLEALNWELDRYSGLQDLPDDVSCVMLDYSGPESAEEA